MNSTTAKATTMIKASTLQMIARNAVKHYRQKVSPPVFNPSVGHFYLLRKVNGLLRFVKPTVRDWAVFARASHRPGTLATMYKGIPLHTSAAAFDLSRVNP